MNQGDVTMYGEKNGPSKWTDEIDEVMRVNWTIGISATDCVVIIYAKFGVMFTRNAIIGRGRRKGYQTSAPPHRHGPPGVVKMRMPKRTTAFRAPAPPSDSLALLLAIKPSTKPMQPHKNAPKSRNLTLLELPPHGCRYPTSPDDAVTHLFCGAPQAEGFVYCVGHAGLCYRATPRQMESKGPVLIACNAGDGAGI